MVRVMRIKLTFSVFEKVITLKRISCQSKFSQHTKEQWLLVYGTLRTQYTKAELKI